MKITWVILANASMAHIYSVAGKNSIDSIKLITKLEHPKSRKKRQELASDRPGHYKTRESARGAYSEHTDPKQIEGDKFAKEIADFLEKNRITDAYQSLILVAAPRFYGLLMKHFHKPLHQLIQKVFEKEIVTTDEYELKNYIHRILHV